MPFASKLQADYIELFNKKVDHIPLKVDRQNIIEQLKNLFASQGQSELDEKLDPNLYGYIDSIKNLYDVEMYLFPQQMRYRLYENKNETDFLSSDSELEENYLHAVILVDRTLNNKQHNEALELKEQYENEKYAEAKKEYLTILSDRITSRIAELQNLTDDSYQASQKDRENESKKREEFEQKIEKIKPPTIDDPGHVNSDPWLLRKLYQGFSYMRRFPELVKKDMIKNNFPSPIMYSLYSLLNIAKPILILPVAIAITVVKNIISFKEDLQFMGRYLKSIVQSAVSERNTQNTNTIDTGNNDSQLSISTAGINSRLQATTNVNPNSRPVSIIVNNESTNLPSNGTNGALQKQGTFKEGAAKDQSQKSKNKDLDPVTLSLGRGPGQRHF